MHMHMFMCMYTCMHPALLMQMVRHERAFVCFINGGKSLKVSVSAVQDFIIRNEAPKLSNPLSEGPGGLKVVCTPT